MKQRYPQFASITEGQPLHGCRLYRWNLGDQLSAYIFLVISPKSDAFTMEAGWSTDGHFPFDIYPMVPIALPECGISKDAPADDKFRFRLPMLWIGKDFWWHLSGRPGPDDHALEEFLADGWIVAPPDYSPEQIATVVRDAMQKIDAYALPYFRKTAKELGEL